MANDEVGNDFPDFLVFLQVEVRDARCLAKERPGALSPGAGD
jgi:hypothetical protein